MKFPLFRKKKTRRGAGKSPEAKAREEQAKTEAHLARMWRRYLEGHPNFAMELAKAKYGITTGEEMGGMEEPDFLEQIELVKKAKTSMDSIFGSGQNKGQGWLSQLPDIMRAMPELVEGLKKMAPMMAPDRQIEEGSPPRVKQALKEPEKATQLDAQQQSIVDYAELLMALAPKEAALDIYENKLEDEADIRNRVWLAVTQNDYDSLVAMLKLIPSMPKYQFLLPTLAKLDQTWFATVYDDIHILKQQEDGVLEPQTEIKEE